MILANILFAAKSLMVSAITVDVITSQSKDWDTNNVSSSGKILTQIILLI